MWVGVGALGVLWVCCGCVLWVCFVLWVCCVCVCVCAVCCVCRDTPPTSHPKVGRRPAIAVWDSGAVEWDGGDGGGKVSHLGSLSFHSRGISSLSFSHDGTLLVTTAAAAAATAAAAAVC